VKKLRYFFEAALVRSMTWIFPRVPRPLLLGLARLVGLLTYWVDWKGRPVALANLRAAFGPELSEEQAQRLALTAYQNFARTFFDLFWSPKMNASNWQQYASVSCPPEIEALARERGAVWLTPHFGNFEFIGLLWGLWGFPFTVIAQDFKNPLLTGIFSQLRAGSGHTVVPQQSAVLRLARTLARGGHVAMLADLNIKPSPMAAVIECFGLPTCVTVAHCQLAQRYNIPLVPCVCLPDEDGTCHSRVLGAVLPEPGLSPRDLAQRCWDMFEAEIRQNPGLWMWMYKHWRYLPGDERDGRYPFYANRQKDFAAMVRG
jgi:Kdo2-lipid IVA lauroyltransferase/acyltransferase